MWTSRFGILLEKTASTAHLPNATSVPMPRLFSLAHPLEEMCPVLVRPLIGTMGYMLDSDYRVVYTDARTDLVLMYDNKMKKHFVSRLRRATDEEATAICECAGAVVRHYCIAWQGSLRILDILYILIILSYFCNPY